MKRDWTHKAVQIMLTTFALFLAGCGQTESGQASKPSTASKLPSFQTNDTSVLDDSAKYDPSSAAIAVRVKQFYQAIQKKDWPTTYEMRTADFKKDVTKDFYLKEMAHDGKKWTLKSYKVLNITSYDNAVQLIMEFQERGIHSYNCSLWKKEAGTWVCDEPGLSGLALMDSTRIPDWANH